MAAKAHGLNGKPCLIHGVHQSLPFFSCHVQAAQLRVGLIDADLHKIKAGGLGLPQLFLQGKCVWH